MYELIIDTLVQFHYWLSMSCVEYYGHFKSSKILNNRNLTLMEILLLSRAYSTSTVVTTAISYQLANFQDIPTPRF